MSARRARVVVHGIVQGVGFRWCAQAEARRLGVGGSIRNRFDGAVEAEVEGDPDAVGSMLDWLARGPASATVERTEVTELEPRGDAGPHGDRELRITG